MPRTLSVILLTMLSFHITAQDSLWRLSKDELVSIVRQYHPVVRQAEYRVGQAGAKVIEARGNFDPTVGADLDRKTFDGDFYYSYFNPELKIPTWYGIELKAGGEEIIGDRVTSESTLGKTSYAGVNVSVMKGLLFDERRAVLRQAQAMEQMTEAERSLMVNNILYDALAVYWNWVQAYNTYRIYANVVKVNRDRLKFVRLEYEQGNRPAIDTVEAMTQLQSYQLLESEFWLEFQNSGLELSNYLWLDNNIPVNWSERIVPDSGLLSYNFTVNDIPSLERLVTEALSQHPKLSMARYKINALEIERKLKFQNFLPTLDVSANMLNKGYELPNEISTPFLENNYKLGVDFSIPLFYRKAVGGYRSAKLKVLETEVERDYTALQIENKVKSYYNEVLTLQQQIELYEAAYRNFSTMYRGEMTRYEIGESNLFLINSRENKLLTTQEKLLQLKTKWHKSYAGLLWAAGVLR